MHDLNQLKGKHDSRLNNIHLSIHKIIADVFTSVAKFSMKDNFYPIAKSFIYTCKPTYSSNCNRHSRSQSSNRSKAKIDVRKHTVGVPVRNRSGFKAQPMRELAGGLVPCHRLNSVSN